MPTLRGGEGGDREDVTCQEGVMLCDVDKTASGSNAGATSTRSPSLSISLSSSSSCTTYPISLQSSTEVLPPSADAGPAFLSQKLPYAHLLDTLPYVDALSPEQHEAAKLLVQQEMAAIRRERSSGSRRQQQQQSDSSSGELQQEQQHREIREEETPAVAGQKAHASAATAAAGKGASGGGRTKQQTGGDGDANVEDDVLQSYLKTFPLPRTPHLDDPNTLAGKELARLAKGESMQKLDLSRYEALPSPPAAGTKAQESEWKKCIDNCEGLLEHLGIGQTNLELMNLHAVSIWMRHLHGLALDEQHWAAAAKRVRGEVDRVSKQRKLDQVECSGSLRDTARMREDYERRNEEILAALGKLQQEVVELKVRCHDRGVLPDDYDSDFEEDLENWEALVSRPSLPTPAVSSDIPVHIQRDRSVLEQRLTTFLRVVAAPVLRHRDSAAAAAAADCDGGGAAAAAYTSSNTPGFHCQHAAVCQIHVYVLLARRLDISAGAAYGAAAAPGQAAARPPSISARVEAAVAAHRQTSVQF